MSQYVSENTAPSKDEEEALLRAEQIYVDQAPAAVAMEISKAKVGEGFVAPVVPAGSAPLQPTDYEDETPFSLIGDSVASRKIVTGSRGAFSVNVYNVGSRQIGCESYTEYLALRTILTLRNDVITVEEQIPPFTYIDERGKTRQHYIDFRVTLANGERIGIAVKPEVVARRRGFRKTLRLIAEAMPKSVADRIDLITDKMIPPELRSFVAAVESARADQQHRPMQTAADDAAAARVIATMAGAWTLGHLQRAIGLPDGRSFRAVVRAIASGKLSMPDGFRLADDEYVRCNT
ncbi:hypothetical protein [Phreatobacter oligotrophus]|uniref:hypothetical protein n=1 Tax=Phreatobacter oligotrophus TaxID=1122261 RepID=UPI0023528592|nr:hypothetical protein [Phreatobacter oligotrophus]MBX9990173.1 hypothetical protein [Phreatobacter oligotrophus]